MRIEHAPLLRTALVGSLFLPLSMSAAASSTQAEIEAFLDTSYELVPSSSLDVRFSELVPSDGANSSTHILIEGLVPLQGDTWTSSYTGIDSSDGSEYDVGQLYITMPSGSASSTSGPIVGIAPRAGGWDGYTNNAPSTSLTGASGQVTYDPDAGTMSFSLDAGGTVFSGTADYTMVDDYTVDLDALTLTSADQSTTVQFAAARLALWNNEFYGVLVNADANPAYDSTMFALRLQGDLQGSIDIPTWAGNWVSVSTTANNWWSWNFKYMFGSGNPNIWFIQEFGSWVYIDPASGLGSLAGFWMYYYNWFDVPTGETGGGSWVYVGKQTMGLREMDNDLLKIRAYLYSARTGHLYFFSEYDNAQENPGNYFLVHNAAAGADGNSYWMVQVPFHDSNGTRL